MLSEIYSAGLSGIDSFIVTVEVDGAPVLPYFEIGRASCRERV